MYMVHLNLILIIPQLWMMRGQIEEQQGNTDAAREIYNRAVSTLSIRCTHTCTHCWCNDGTLFVCLVEEGSSGHLPVAAISSPGGKLWAFDKGKIYTMQPLAMYMYMYYKPYTLYSEYETNLLSPFIFSICLVFLQLYTSVYFILHHV